MTTVKRSVPWTRQPQQETPLNPAIPAPFAWFDGRTGVAYSGGARTLAPPAAVAGHTVNNGGVSTDMAPSSYAPFYIPNTSKAMPNGMSFLAVGLFKDAPSIEALLARDRTANSGGFEVTLYNLYGSPGNRCYGSAQNTALSGSWLDGKSDAARDNPTFSRTVHAHSGYFAGAIAASGVDINIGAIVPVGFYSDIGVMLVVVWDKVIDPALLQSLSANPWQLFAPMTRHSPAIDPAPVRMTRRVPRAQQPQGAFTLSSKFPKVADVWVGSHAITHKGFTATVSAGVYPTVSEVGMGYAFDADPLPHITIASELTSYFDVSENTVSVLRRCKDTVNRNNCLFGADGGENRFLAHAPWGDGNLYFDGWSVTYGRISTPFVKTTEWEVLTFVTSLTRGREVWRNGVLIASNTTITGIRSAAVALPVFLGSAAYAGTSDYQEIALFVVAHEAWSPALIREFGSQPRTSPWQLFAPITRRFGLIESVAIYRPSSDTLVSGWASTTSSLASAINETTPSDIEYVTSPILGSDQPAIMLLDYPLVPGSYNVTIRGNFSGTRGTLTVSLTDGTTTWAGSPTTMTGTYSTYVVPITISGTATQVKLDVTT